MLRRLESRHVTAHLSASAAAGFFEFGHSTTLRRLAADGDWHCADVLAQAALSARDEGDGGETALALYRPFAESGHP
jgi:hypothetical protein